MKINKKNLIIISIIIVIVFATILLTIYLNQSKQDKGTMTINNWNSSLLDSSATIEKINQALKTNVISYQVIIGKDSYLNQKLEANIMKKNNLNTYEQQQTKYVKNVEQQIKNNFKYTQTKTVTSETKDKIVYFKLKTYNYNLYYLTLNSLQQKLLNLKGYTQEQLTTQNTLTLQIDTYKAKIKAMSILNNYLKDFIDDKYYSYNIIIQKKDNYQSSSLINNYLAMIQGNYDYQLGQNQKTINNNVDKKVNNYLTKEKSKINNKKPLKL